MVADVPTGLANRQQDRQKNECMYVLLSLLSLGSYPNRYDDLRGGVRRRGGGDEDLTDWLYLARVGQAVESDRQLLMQLHGCGPRDPVELPAPAPSLVGAAVVAAHRRQRRRLPRRLPLQVSVVIVSSTISTNAARFSVFLGGTSTSRYRWHQQQQR